MAYNSFKTRKALGRRYGTDPALQMEMERLQQEYNLTPGREARGLQASQFDRELAFRNEQAKSTEKGAMASSLGNAAMTGLTLYKLGGGELGSIYPAIKSGVSSAYNGVSGLFGGAAPVGTGAAATSVAPALIDTAAAGIGAGEMASAGGLAATGSGAALTSGAGEMASMSGVSASAPAGGMSAVAGPAAIVGAAELAKGQWGELNKGYDEKSTFGKFTSAPGVLAATGMIPTQFAKEGTAVSNVTRELSRIEQQLMQPIDKLLGIDNSSIKWVLCSELVRQGKLNQKIVDEEWEYVRQIITAEEYNGYRIIADPLVKLMQKSKIFTLIMTPLIRAFAYEMASRVNFEIKGNYLGKIILLIGLPLCSLVAQKEVCNGNVG